MHTNNYSFTCPMPCCSNLVTALTRFGCTGYCPRDEPVSVLSQVTMDDVWLMMPPLVAFVLLGVIVMGVAHLLQHRRPWISLLITFLYTLQVGRSMQMARNVYYEILEQNNGKLFELDAYCRREIFGRTPINQELCHRTAAFYSRPEAHPLVHAANSLWKHVTEMPQ